MLLLLLAACDDDVFPAPPGGDTIVGDSLADVTAIFEGDCHMCHSAAMVSGGLDLETDPCGALVGVEASGYDAVLVVPGDHAGSVLWNKVADTGAYRDVMPPGTRMPQENIDTIAAWIDGGAVCDDDSGDGDDTAATAVAYTYQDVQGEVFEPYCVTCHVQGGDPLAEFLDLSRGAAYEAIVDVPAALSNDGFDLVEPKQPQGELPHAEGPWPPRCRRGCPHAEGRVPPRRRGDDARVRLDPRRAPR